MRAALAFVAALFVATASLIAPVSELTEEMHHAAAHADDDASPAMQADSGAPQHQHPDTPGHSHCGAACHIQLSDDRSALAVVYLASRALFVAFDDRFAPPSHLDGLFRPPRA